MKVSSGLYQIASEVVRAGLQLLTRFHPTMPVQNLREMVERAPRKPD